MGLDLYVSWLLYSSFMGGFLAGFLLLIRKTLQGRVSAGWQYLIWFLLVLKLLIPWAPESSAGLFSLVHSLTDQALGVQGFRLENGREIYRGTGTERPAAGTSDFTDEETLPVTRPGYDTGAMALLGLWLSGVAALTGYMIYLSGRTRRLVNSGKRVTDERMLRLLAICRQTMQLRYSPELIESPLIKSPMVVGVVRPRIVVPVNLADQIGYRDVRFVLLHELAHLRRGDLYTNWIITFLQIIHWFNPMIWCAFRQMRRDRELACDAAVLSVLAAEEYKGYGTAMISLLEHYAQPLCEYTSAGLASGKNHLRNRISMIAGYRKNTMVRRLRERGMILLLGCFVLTNAPGASQAAWPGGAPAPEPAQPVIHEDLSRYFQEYDGAFVLFDMEKGQYRLYHEANSRQRVSPDSTYKIISSLVGLETGILQDEHTSRVWDGTVYPFERWNRDQTLASAMAQSVSWYFAESDAAVGKQALGRYLAQSGYGNGDLSGDMKDFWVESSLKISPWEQVELLRKLYTYELPFSRRNIDIVKNIIKVPEQGTATLSGKTGTGIVNGHSVNGWFVGYVENAGKVYVFATNIQGKERADGVNARNITLSILKDKNIL
ncbi:MAG TPA: BlaR1 family beta-lactam sensor/signal transducer [Patescibacteria group bacterium]|nr:BlaR1 family beta-lactam sensor/signal transducer [Patescibacteria group bacterium]